MKLYNGFLTEKTPVALTYEEIVVGRKARLEVRFDPALIDMFARMTGDFNPLHMSDAFARAKGQQGRVAHGLLTAAFFSTVAGMMLPGRDCLIQHVKFDFRRPVPAGADLIMEAEVIQKVDAVKSLVLALTASDPGGIVYVTGRLNAGVTA